MQYIESHHTKKSRYAHWGAFLLDISFKQTLCQTSEKKSESYQVWLRGSQFSLPTFSMQNFCGPLLPVTLRQQNTLEKLILSPTIVKHACLFILQTHQVPKSTHRKATGSCYKLQESHPFFIVHFLHKLQTDTSILTSESQDYLRST